MGYNIVSIPPFDRQLIRTCYPLLTKIQPYTNSSNRIMPAWVKATLNRL